MIRGSVLTFLLCSFSCCRLFLHARCSLVYVELCCSSHFRWGETTGPVSRRTRCILLFREESESGESGHFSYSFEKSAPFLEYQMLHIISPLQHLTSSRKSEDVPSGSGWRCLPDSGWMFYRRSPGNPFDRFLCSLRGPAFASRIASCEASFLFLLSVAPFLFWVGLWSPKVLESEWASNNSRPGSSVGLFGAQPTLPSSVCLTDSFRHGSAASIAAACIKTSSAQTFPHCQRQGTKLEASMTLIVRSRQFLSNANIFFCVCPFKSFRAICSCCMLPYRSELSWD